MRVIFHHPDCYAVVVFVMDAGAGAETPARLAGVFATKREAKAAFDAVRDTPICYGAALWAHALQGGWRLLESKTLDDAQAMLIDQRDEARSLAAALYGALWMFTSHLMIDDNLGVMPWAISCGILPDTDADCQPWPTATRDGSAVTAGAGAACAARSERP